MRNVASLMMCSDDYICPLNYPLPATEVWSLTQRGHSPSGATFPISSDWKPFMALNLDQFKFGATRKWRRFPLLSMPLIRSVLKCKRRYLYMLWNTFCKYDFDQNRKVKKASLTESNTVLGHKRLIAFPKCILKYSSLVSVGSCSGLKLVGFSNISIS